MFVAGQLLYMMWRVLALTQHVTVCCDDSSIGGLYLVIKSVGEGRAGQSLREISITLSLDMLEYRYLCTLLNPLY